MIIIFGGAKRIAKFAGIVVPFMAIAYILVALIVLALNVGDTVLGLNLSHGGHLTHGSPVNFSGNLYNVVPYGVREDNQLLDYNAHCL